MVTVSRARKILGKKYSHLSDEEIELLIGQTYYLAELAIGLKEKKVFQGPSSLIDIKGGKNDHKAKG